VIYFVCLKDLVNLESNLLIISIKSIIFFMLIDPKQLSSIIEYNLLKTLICCSSSNVVAMIAFIASRISVSSPIFESSS